jgi:hypothetical protein
MKKTITGLLFAAGLTVAALAPTSPAIAGVDVNIYIAPGPGWLVVPGPGRLSCRQAAYRLHNRGYRNIGVVDCRGKVYAYIARKNGHRWYIQVSSYTGAVIRVRRA